MTSLTKQAYFRATLHENLIALFSKPNHLPWNLNQLLESAHRSRTDLLEEQNKYD